MVLGTRHHRCLMKPTERADGADYRGTHSRYLSPRRYHQGSDLFVPWRPWTFLLRGLRLLRLPAGFVGLTEAEDSAAVLGGARDVEV